MNKKKVAWVTAIVLLILVIDQALKIWVKTNMSYGQEFSILGLPWAYIHFVENNGMAFGFAFGGQTGKLILSLFRIAAVAFLIYYIKRLIKEGYSMGLLVCFALILAGAIGNILDSAFYGLIFSESVYHAPPAELFPEGGGYAKFLFGKVVDMFYFPVIDTYWPQWMPGIGGKKFEFFRPVFNVADAAISTGIIAMLLFHRSFFKNTSTKEKQDVAASEMATSEAADAK